MLPGVHLGRGAGLVAVAVAATVAIGGACADSGADDAPIGLPDRVSSNEAGDGAGTRDAAGDVVGDGSPADANGCGNGKKDGAETDVDCGGPACAPCANGKGCALRRDCAAMLCVGSTCTGDVGCSDGTREGFTLVATFGSIAACGGGWSVAGLKTTTLPACERLAGNDSPTPTGAGCNVADLCQIGWHVCETAAEVAAKSGAGGCAGAAVAGSFFATRQSGGGSAACGVGANDLFGCGGAGGAPNPATCAPLDRFSDDLCASLPAGWACGADGTQEANNVTKTTSSGGGVLCCRD